MSTRAAGGSVPQAEEYFAPDWATARARFREAASAVGAALHTLTLSAVSPQGEPLTIDIGWLGAQDARRVFIHTTGLHGIEAYTGSAVQLAFLASSPAPRNGSAFVLVHVLNPYGMAWLRRTNENNVDLNRNFLLNGEDWAGAPPLYATLDRLLNPPSPPARDAFALRLVTAALRHGVDRVKRAIAAGQYEHPQSLFFGGRELQDGPRQYAEWLRHHLAHASYVFALDFHTGLGRRGTDVLMPEPGVNVSSRADLGAALNRTLIDQTRPGVAYTVRGGLGSAMPHLLPRTAVDFVLQEIGTEPHLRVLRALRDENRWHFHGDGRLDHPAKLRLREALCPSHAEWRRQAVRLGLEVAVAAAGWTAGRERR